MISGLAFASYEDTSSQSPSIVCGSGSLDSMSFKVLSSVHMAQAAAAQDPSQELVQAPEQGIETGKSPEHGELGNALESGSKEKVVSLFKKDAQAEVEARKRLGLVESGEKQISPEIVSPIEAANDNSYNKIEEAESLAIKQVDMALGEPANEAPPAPVAA